MDYVFAVTAAEALAVGAWCLAAPPYPHWPALPGGVWSCLALLLAAVLGLTATVRSGPWSERLAFIAIAFIFTAGLAATLREPSFGLRTSLLLSAVALLLFIKRAPRLRTGALVALTLSGCVTSTPGSQAPNEAPEKNLPARVEGNVITLGGVPLSPNDDVEGAIAKSRAGAELLQVELVPGYRDEALGRLLENVTVAGIRSVQLRAGADVLDIATTRADSARLLVSNRAGQLHVYDNDATSAAAGTLGHVNLGDAASEEALREELERACRDEPCHARLGLTPGKGADIWQALETWQRLTASLPALTSELQVRAETPGAVTAGFLPAALIQAVVRSHFPRFRKCYELGLARSASLKGTVSARFVIGLDGKTNSVSGNDSTLPDAQVIACIVKVFESMHFPEPADGIITVIYPIMLAPG